MSRQAYIWTFILPSNIKGVIYVVEEVAEMVVMVVYCIGDKVECLLCTYCAKCIFVCIASVHKDIPKCHQT